MARQITYREFLTGQAASVISCLAGAINDASRMDTEFYSVRVLESALVTSRELLKGKPNPERVGAPPTEPGDD